MSEASVQEFVQAQNREQAFGLYVHATGCLDDMGVDFEVRDERGWLIGHAATFYGWDAMEGDRQ